MRTILLLALVVVTLVAQEPQQPEPEYRHDKYASDPHARCMRPEVVEFSPNPSFHACSCHQTCVVDTDEEGKVTGQRVAEDPQCELYCTKSRCGCHADESVCPVTIPEAK